VAGLTLDSGALIGYERNDRSVVVQIKAALQMGLDVTVPAVVLAEVWRGGPRAARLARVLSSCIIADVDESQALRAGEAIARVPGAGTVDALVMASAATRGDTVLTGDFQDLSRLRAAFAPVNVVPI
jgi:predicted nucleic acid-binding protein